MDEQSQRHKLNCNAFGEEVAPKKIISNKRKVTGQKTKHFVSNMQIVKQSFSSPKKEFSKRSRFRELNICAWAGQLMRGVDNTGSSSLTAMT